MIDGLSIVVLQIAGLMLLTALLGWLLGWTMGRSRAGRGARTPDLAAPGTETPVSPGGRRFEDSRESIRRRL